MSQDQILRARWSANRIGLNEAHALQGAFECCRFREVPRDGESSQVVDRDRAWTRITGLFTGSPLHQPACPAPALQPRTATRRAGDQRDFPFKDLARALILKPISEMQRAAWAWRLILRTPQLNRKMKMSVSAFMR